MLSKKARPMIGKISELLVSGGRAMLPDAAGSPRSPLDMNLRMQSPRGLKNYDLGGVGLGIVVALDKSSEVGGEILPKYAVFPSNLNRSEPVQVHSIKSPDGLQKGVNEIDVGSLENYTYVTCHMPDKPFTKVYYDGGEAKNWRRHGVCINHNHNKVGVPRRKETTLVEAEPSYPTSDFLSSCNLCQKKLHGIDIYMYRGEKAFCSPECRSRQIMKDERKEQCRSEASSWSVELSSSPYERDQIFSSGILAI